MSVQTVRALMTASSLLMAAGCASDLVGPAAALRVVTASAPELAVGGQLRLDASVGGTRLLPAQVEWLSRDPSTLTVRDGIVRGISPGSAYVLAIRRTAVDSIRLTVVFSDLAAGQAGVRSGNDLLRLTGAAWLTQSTADASAYYTTIIASSGGIADTPTGGCCIVQGDTTLQLNFVGRLQLGARTLLPPDVRIETGLTNILFHTGADDVLLMVRDGGFRMRFYFPVRPALLEVLVLDDASATKVGRVRGRLSFEAAGILEEHDNGKVTYAPIGNRTTKIYAEFDTPLNFRLFTPPVIHAP
jgi:hypothetical protein